MRCTFLGLWGILYLTTVAAGGTHEVRKQILLSLNELPRRIIRDNLGLQMKRLDLQFQGRERKKVVANWLPQLVYQGSFTRNLERPEFVFNINGSEQRFRIGSRYNYLHSLQVYWPVFAGGERLYHLKGEHWQYRSLVAELAGEEAVTIRDAVKLYFAILLSRETVRARRVARQTALENLRLARALFAEGSATALDTLRAGAQASATLPPLLAARAREHQLRQQLKQLINVSLTDSLVLQDSLVAIDYLKRLGTPSLDQWQRWALNRRAEIQALQASRQASSQQRKAAITRYLPSVSLVYALDQQAQVNRFFPAREDYVRAQRATVNLQWTLFQGGVRTYTLQQTRIREKQLQLQEQQLRQQILLDVERAYQNWQEARAQLVNLRKRSGQAREAYRLARLYFQEGQATQLEVLSAHSEFIASRLALAEGIYRLNISQVELLYASGMVKEIWP